MSGELTVRLSGATGERMITRLAANLSFKSIDPGGYASVQLDLKRPLTASDLDPFSQIAVFDAETGEQVAGGRLLDPGKSVSSSGEVWSLVALGEGLAHAEDQERPYILIDSTLDDWRALSSSQTKVTWSAAPAPSTEANGVLARVSDGATAIAGFRHTVAYKPIFLTSQSIGGIGYTLECGQSNVFWRMMLFVGDLGTPVKDNAWTTGAVSVVAEVGEWASGEHTAYLRVERTDTTIVATEDTWAHASALRVLARRYDRTGALIEGAGKYNTTYITAEQAITDLWARMCPRFDLANARIDAGTDQFTQLAWPEGVTPAKVMGELMDGAPAYTWHVWEQLPSGKFRAEWVARPTTVRYEIGVEDGFSGPGGTSGLVNTAWVVGTNVNGKKDSWYHTSANPVLDAEGLTRAITIDMGDEVFTEARADAVAVVAIEDSRLSATAASVTVGRNVYDHELGRWVHPYQIVPGELCRINGIRPGADTLNPAGVDGSTIFRIVSNDYSTSSASSNLELNSYTLTEARAIANLTRKR